MGAWYTVGEGWNLGDSVIGGVSVIVVGGVYEDEAFEDMLENPVLVAQSHLVPSGQSQSGLLPMSPFNLSFAPANAFFNVSICILKRIKFTNTIYHGASAFRGN
jgi:hypothetical protein